MRSPGPLFLAVALVSASPSAGAEPTKPTRAEQETQATVTARNLAHDGQCGAVRDLGRRVAEADPDYYARVFAADPVLAKCLPAREIHPLAVSAIRIDAAGAVPAQQAPADCGEGLYLEPSLYAGASYQGNPLVVLRHAGGLEMHNCDRRGHWGRAVRIGMVASLANYQAGLGGEVEVAWVTGPDRRAGVRIGVDTGWVVTTGARYRVGDVALGVDLIVATGSGYNQYAAPQKGVLVGLTLGGKPGRATVAAEAVVIVGLTALVLASLSNGH